MRPLLTLLAAFILIACAATAPKPPVAEPTPWSRTPPPAPLAVAPWTEPAAHEVRLPNGLRVVVVQRRGRPTVSIRLLLQAGAAWEQKARAGVTWLALASLEDRFEERRDDGELLNWDEKSARREMAEFGGSLGFGVTHEASWLSVDGYSVDVDKYLEMLWKIMEARRQGPDGFASRRDYLLDAIEDLELGDHQTLVEQLTRLAFGPQHPYAQRIIGTVQSLDQLGMEDIVIQQNAVLQPKGATLLVVGNVDAAKITAKAASVFRKWSNTSTRVEPQMTAPAITTRRAVHLVPRTPARTTAVCGARALSDITATDAALDVFAETVGNLRLRQALREERTLTYGVLATVVRHRRGQALMFCTRLPTSQTAEGLQALVHTLQQLKALPPSAEEVRRAKAVVQSRLAAERADVRGIVAAWSKAIELARPSGLAEQQRAVAEVDAADLEKLTQRVLALDQLQFVLSGDRTVMEAAVKASGLGRTAIVKVAHE